MNSFEVSPESVREFTAFRDSIVARTVDRILETDSQLARMVNARQMVNAGITMTAGMLESAITFSEPVILQEQAKWASVRLPVDGIPVDSIVRNLELFSGFVSEYLQKNHAAEINQYIQYLINQLREYTPGGSYE